MIRAGSLYALVLVLAVAGPVVGGRAGWLLSVVALVVAVALVVWWVRLLRGSA